MLPSNRSRFDRDKQIALTIEGGLSTDHLPDLARQEFKNEADINNVIRRVGPDGLIHRQGPVYTETDFGLDLMTALNTVAEVKAAHRRLPRALREQYPTWVSLIAGIESGTFKRDLLQEEKPAPEPEPAPEPPPPG